MLLVPLSSHDVIRLFVHCGDFSAVKRPIHVSLGWITTDTHSDWPAEILLSYSSGTRRSIIINIVIIYLMGKNEFSSVFGIPHNCYYWGKRLIIAIILPQILNRYKVQRETRTDSSSSSNYNGIASYYYIPRLLFSQYSSPVLLLIRAHPFSFPFHVVQ